MKIHLHCHPAPGPEAIRFMTWQAYEQWLTSSSQASGDIAALQPQVGPGASVLCSSHPAAVAAAQRLYPDRRIEVKKLYNEPQAPPPHIPVLRLSPALWHRLALLRWSLGFSESTETHEVLRRRIIDASIRLTELAKQHDDAVLMAGPALLRRIGLKLVSIGWRGPFLTAPYWSEERIFTYSTGALSLPLRVPEALPGALPEPAP